MTRPNSDQHRLYDLRAEYWRRICRRELVPFAVHALAPKGEAPARHHRRICAELEAVARGDVLRLMVLAPPASAKTTYVSRLFPAWYFATRAHSNIIAASHTAELAETNTSSATSATIPTCSITGCGMTTRRTGRRRTIAATGRSVSAGPSPARAPMWWS